MDGDEPWEAPGRGESSQTLLPQTFHSWQNDTAPRNTASNLWHTSAQKTLIICLWWKVKHPASSFEVINTSSVQETFQGLSKFNKVSELLDNNQSQPGFFVQFSLPFFKGLMLLYFDPSHLKPLVFNWQLLAFPISVSNTFTNWCIVW